MSTATCHKTRIIASAAEESADEKPPIATVPGDSADKRRTSAIAAGEKKDEKENSTALTGDKLLPYRFRRLMSDAMDYCNKWGNVSNHQIYSNY